MKIRFSRWIMLLAVAISFSGCAMQEHNLPPAARLRGPGPGIDGPGPAIMPPMMPPPGMMMQGGMQMPGQQKAVQVLFNSPDGMQVRWDVTGSGGFDSLPLITPGRHNFPEGGIFRLKLTNIEGLPGVELFPTVEIGPTTPRTDAFLAHNAIPVQFTTEDFEQVMAGNFVTKVIYLPDPEFQQMALANVETLVSTRLDPGVDPVTEADRRGAIMGVIRLGNKDVELPGTGVGAPAIIPVSHQDGRAGINGGPVSLGPAHGGPYGTPPSHVAGVTAPQWGMPITGTPIGLPGPPHLPHGHPAGLTKHSIHNHTRMYLPPPTKDIRIDVRQQPGFSYPTPASRARITEQSIHPSLPYGQPAWNQHQRVQ
jgi:hypothetical protein